MKSDRLTAISASVGWRANGLSNVRLLTRRRAARRLQLCAGAQPVRAPRKCECRSEKPQIIFVSHIIGQGKDRSRPHRRLERSYAFSLRGRKCVTPGREKKALARECAGAMPGYAKGNHKGVLYTVNIAWGALLMMRGSCGTRAPPSYARPSPLMLRAGMGKKWVT